MHDYPFDTELVRFAFILGVIVAIVWYNRLHITTGSLIVPGYIGVFFLQPISIALTLLIAGLAFLIGYRVLPRFTTVYRRSRFFALVLFSVGAQILLLRLNVHSVIPGAGSPALIGIGYIVPALIAHDMGRQGVRNTITGALGAGMIVALAVLVMALLVPGLKLDGAPLNVPEFAFDLNFIPFAVLISALAAIALRHTYGLRAGGFVGGAYLALIFGDVFQMVAVAGLAVLTYVIVMRVLAPRLLLFGRRKFAAMLLVGSLLAWALATLTTQLFHLREPGFSALPMIGIVLAGLLANDIERVGLRRVTHGTVLAVLLVLPTILLAEELTGARRAGTAAPLAVAAVAMWVIVFGRYALTLASAGVARHQGAPSHASMDLRLARLRQFTPRGGEHAEIPGGIHAFGEARTAGYAERPTLRYADAQDGTLAVRPLALRTRPPAPRPWGPLSLGGRPPPTTDPRDGPRTHHDNGGSLQPYQTPRQAGAHTSPEIGHREPPGRG